MPSSAGSNNPELRSSLWLIAVALAALAGALLLAFTFAFVTAPRPAGRSLQARPATAQTPMTVAATQRSAPAASSGAAAGVERLPLWALLAPWAFAVDALAVLGLAAVLLVRYLARRRRGART
ncbi:MAG: hypothetical protein ACREM2_07420 [Vulcanimicrobiaceae bacterium]